MKYYTWNYALSGVRTMIPLYISVWAETEEESIEKAKEFIRNNGGLYDFFRQNSKITFFSPPTIIE